MMTTAPKTLDNSPEKIRELLTSATAEGVLLGFVLLDALGTREAWQAVVNRSVAYSICCFCRDSDLPFPTAMKADFSPESTAALVAACEEGVRSRESRKEFKEYDRLRLCEAFSPVGLEFFDSVVPIRESVSYDDAPFVTAFLGGPLGQVLWRDLALAGHLTLYYEPSAYVGDRLMPDTLYHLMGEDAQAADSFGCQFICGHGESYSLPWISTESFIDPEAIRQVKFYDSGFENEWHEDFEPGFSATGLMYSALEGLCAEHVVLVDTPQFDKKIMAVFADFDGEWQSARITVLDQPVLNGMPAGRWADLEPRKQEWIIDCLLTAATNDAYREPAALAKHVLCWMTRHSATPPASRDRLVELGFGIEVKQRAATAASDASAAQPQLEKPDAASLKRLRKIVKSWKSLCDAEFPDGLEKDDFLAAHYAQLVIHNDVALTQSGWEFIGDTEDKILDAAENAGEDE